MVMLVLGQVLGQVGNSLRQHGYLETGGPGVFLARLEVVDINFAHNSLTCVWVDFSWLRQIDLTR